MQAAAEPRLVQKWERGTGSSDDMAARRLQQPTGECETSLRRPGFHPMGAGRKSAKRFGIPFLDGDGKASRYASASSLPPGGNCSLRPCCARLNVRRMRFVSANAFARLRKE